MAAAQYYEEVQQAYLAYYGRPADPAGQEYWAMRLDNAGGNLSSIINEFGTSTESTALYGGSNLAAQITAIYQTLFGRAPDAEGLNFYQHGINTGEFTLASVALNIYYGATGTDKAQLDAKQAYADAFTNALSASVSAQIAYSGKTASDNARAAVAAVTDTASEGTAAAHLESTLANINAGAVGQTVTLTTGVDSITLSGNNNVVNGVVNNGDATANTLNTFDSIKGASGSTGNTLNLVDSSSTPVATDFQAALAGATISNVQNINLVDTSSTVGVTIDASGITGLTNLTVKSAATGADIVKAAATTNVTDTTGGASTITGGNAVTVTASGAVTIGDALGGAGMAPAGAVTVTDKDTGGSAIKVYGGTTVNVTAAGNEVITIGTNSTGQLNAAGTALKAATAATEATGNVTVNESTIDKVTGVATFGTGSATIYTNGATSVSVTGTSTDTITDVQTTANGASVSFGTSTLASVTLDGVAGATSIVSDALTSVTVLDSDNNDSAASVVNITNTSTSYNLSVTVGSNLTTGATAATLETVTIDDVKGTATAVTVSTVGSVASDVTLKAAGATSLTFDNSAKVTLDAASSLAKVATVTAEGSGAVVLGDVSGLTKLTTIDASAATGAVSATLNTTQSFKGGAGNDVVTIGATETTGVLDGGAGTNTLVVTAAGVNTDDSITNFQVLGLGAGATGTFDGLHFSSFAVAGATAAAEIQNIAGTSATLSDAATSNTAGVQLDFKSNNATLNVNLGADDATTATGTNAHNVSLDVSTTTTATVTGATGGVSTLNINSSGITAAQVAAGGAGAHNALNLTADANLQHVTITGDSALTLTTDSNAAVTTVDASAAKGAVDITGVSLAANATVTGGAGSLTADLSYGGDTVNVGTGGGNISFASGVTGDTVTLVSGATAATNLTYHAGSSEATISGSTASGFDVVNGFVNFATATKGAVGGLSDSLSFDATNVAATAATTTLNGVQYTVNKGVFTFTNTANSLATDISTVVSALNAATKDTAAFQYQGNTYVVHAGADVAHSTVVELVGVTGITSLSATAAAHATAGAHDLLV
ncbi:beta strand repeat-containing protein [Paraburkholderia youngii]|uniref:beta strand repeat-containing protein n=1 Tax=Paraburkholderia youngii TaxID=2782701 RepID=UPI003D201C42